MTKFRRAQVAFTAGSLAPRLKGRKDIQPYYIGAERLLNMIPRPAGSCFNRPGTYVAAKLASAAESAGGRLLPFVFNSSQRYVVWIGHQTARVYRSDDAFLVAELAIQFTLDQAATLDWVQIADTMILTHEGQWAPIQIQRQVDGTFTTGAYLFEAAPQFRYWPADVTLTPSATTGSITVTASAPVFTGAGVGSFNVWRLNDVTIRLAAAIDATHATFAVDGTLPDTNPSTDWTEEAFQERWGGPRAVAYWQDRLCFGGGRSAPAEIWLSRSGAPYDFFASTGVTPTDADPIQITASTGRLEHVQYLIPGTRGLEVYTTGDEAVIAGSIDAPATPKTIAYIPQSAIGSRRVKPARLDARTIFAQRDGGVIREGVFSDEEQAIKPVPLSVRAEHLVPDATRLIAAPGFSGYPFDLLLAVNRDGTAAGMTSERSQEVTAWFEIAATRQIIDCCAVGERCFVLTRDATHAWLEFFLPIAIFDHQTSVTQAASATVPGLGDYASQAVQVFADGYWLGEFTVSAGGVLTLPVPVAQVAVGYDIPISLKPMPVESENASLLGRKVRPYRAEIRHLASAGLRVVAGGRSTAILDRPFDNLQSTPPLPQAAVSPVALEGYSNGVDCPVEITRDGPFPVEILSLAIDYRLGG